MADYKPDSLYRNTSIVSNQYLDTLNVDDIDIENTTTRSIKLELKHENKPDLLAYELYGNAKLWWVFALFNPR